MPLIKIHDKSKSEENLCLEKHKKKTQRKRKCFCQSAKTTRMRAYVLAYSLFLSMYMYGRRAGLVVTSQSWSALYASEQVSQPVTVRYAPLTHSASLRIGELAFAWPVSNSFEDSTLTRKKDRSFFSLFRHIGLDSLFESLDSVYF